MTDFKNEDKGVFVNLKSDFGFKKIFARPENKALLISFLNALFQGDIVVEDVVYDNVEMSPDIKEDRGIRYDIYCHIPSQDAPGTATHHFIIEMQNRNQDHFDERALYYVASSLVWQAKRGNDFDFEFVPVIGIFIMDFDRKPEERNDRIVERKWISDIDTHEPFYDLLRMYFVKLPMIPKQAEACKSKRDMWIYCIKNLEKMKSVPFVKEYPILEQLADQARVANLSREEYVEYERSLKVYRDERNIARYYFSQGERKGEKRGEKRGRREANLETARNLKAMGLSAEDISKATGLIVEDILLL